MHARERSRSVFGRRREKSTPRIGVLRTGKTKFESVSKLSMLISIDSER
jgi:hypothetical protein